MASSVGIENKGRVRRERGRRNRHGPPGRLRGRPAVRDVGSGRAGAPRLAQRPMPPAPDPDLDGVAHPSRPFVVLASGAPAEPTLATRRVAVPVLASIAAIVVALALGAVAARRLAEGEAVRDAAERADFIDRKSVV